MNVFAEAAIAIIESDDGRAMTPTRMELLAERTADKIVDGLLDEFEIRPRTGRRPTEEGSQ